MPSFEVSILTAPHSFFDGCKSLNELIVSDPNKFSQICSDAILYVKNKSSLLFSDVNEKDQITKNAYYTVIHIARNLINASPSPTIKEVATVLDSNTILKRETIEAFVTSWNSNTNPTSLAAVTQTGKLENLKWRIGIALQSNLCKDISYPYVYISYQVKDSSGNLSYHNFEISYQDSLKMASKLKQVASIMESL